MCVSCDGGDRPGAEGGDRPGPHRPSIRGLPYGLTSPLQPPPLEAGKAEPRSQAPPRRPRRGGTESYGSRSRASSLRKRTTGLEPATFGLGKPSMIGSLEPNFSGGVSRSRETGTRAVAKTCERGHTSTSICGSLVPWLSLNDSTSLASPRRTPSGPAPSTAASWGCAPTSTPSGSSGPATRASRSGSPRSRACPSSPRRATRGRSAATTSPKCARRSSPEASGSSATRSTPASATWRSSPTPTATSSCCIAGTRRTSRPARCLAGSGLVVEQDVAGTEGPALQQLQGDALICGPEHGLAGAEYDRGHHDPQFVDQPHWQEAHGQIGASEDRDVLAGLPLERCELFADVVLDEPRVGPLGRVQGPRDDDLLEAVHSRRDPCVILLRRGRRPVRGHPLVRDPAEYERVDLVQLLHRELVEFLVDDPTVELLVQPFVVPVEGRHDEREDLSHRTLLG